MDERFDSSENDEDRGGMQQEQCDGCPATEQLEFESGCLQEPDGVDLRTSPALLEDGEDGVADDEQAEEAAKTECGSHHVPLWVKIGASAVLVVCIIGLAVFLWRTSAYAQIPNVIGKTPADAAAEIESISEKWSVTYQSDDDISNLNEDMLNQQYEVTGTVPNVGETVEKGKEQAVAVVLEKNEATKEAERRQSIIQGEIEESLANGWADETYVDGGDVVVFKLVDDEALIRDDGSYLYAPSAWKEEDPDGFSDFYEGNQDLYQQMAEDLKSNVVCLIYTNDGYLHSIFCGVYSGASQESIERAADAAKTARSEHVAHVADNLGEILDYHASLFDGFNGCEYAADGDGVTFYVYGSGFVLRDGDDISNSSAQIEEVLDREARSFAYFLQAPVTTKFVKNGALFASVSAEPESLLYQP